MGFYTKYKNLKKLNYSCLYKLIFHNKNKNKSVFLVHKWTTLGKEYLITLVFYSLEMIRFYIKNINNTLKINIY